MKQHVPAEAFAPLTDPEPLLPGEMVQVNQGLDALTRSKIDPRTLLRLPWDSLHDVLGHLWPEAFWVVGAASGNGKSTFLMQLVHAWALEGKRIYFLPLEQPAKVMRQYWAALANNLVPEKVLENDWAALPSGAEKVVQEHIRWQVSAGGPRNQVVFSEAVRANVDEMISEFTAAARLEAQVIIIDHIHRLDYTGGNPHTALVTMCQALKECAKNFNIPVLAAAQLHRDKEHDVLAPFLPPKPTALQGGEVIRQESDVAIGLFRPLVESFTVEDARLIRIGQKKIRPLVEPNKVGIHVLKHRVRGKALGEIVKLGYEHGKIVCEATDRRLALEDRHGV
jgi:replicative DNA helicase